MTATAMGVLAGVGNEAVGAGLTDGSTGAGRFVNAQQGRQNLDCGNSADTMNVYVLTSVTKKRTCAPGDGPAGSEPAAAAGGVSFGPQSATAQSGRQNLNCGNSADTMNVYVLSSVSEETTCVARDNSGGRRGGNGRDSSAGSEPAAAAGGVSFGPQSATAQSGRQNLNCGNFADAVSLNALSQVSRKTTCVADDDSRVNRRTSTGQGGVAARNGTAVGPRSATAQNGRQNLRCGTDDSLLGVGRIDRGTVCEARDRSRN